MSAPSMRYDCMDGANCFNVKKRLKFAAFKGALERGGMPKLISFSDIDGFFERKGYFFFVEWKGEEVPITTGQDIAFKALTKLSEKVVAYVVNGDAEDMSVVSWVAYYAGKKQDEVQGDLEAFNEQIEAFAREAESNGIEKERILAGRAAKAKSAPASAIRALAP